MLASRANSLPFERLCGCESFVSDGQAILQQSQRKKNRLQPARGLLMYIERLWPSFLAEWEKSGLESSDSDVANQAAAPTGKITERPRQSSFWEREICKNGSLRQVSYPLVRVSVQAELLRRAARDQCRTTTSPTSWACPAFASVETGTCWARMQRLRAVRQSSLIFHAAAHAHRARAQAPAVVLATSLAHSTGGLSEPGSVYRSYP